MLPHCGTGERFALLQAEMFAAEELGWPITKKPLYAGEQTVLDALHERDAMRSTTRVGGGARDRRCESEGGSDRRKRKRKRERERERERKERSRNGPPIS
mgnify:CR=1 FL=1|jgi:hypothetical protein